MIGLNIQMPESCLECPCSGGGVTEHDMFYKVTCYASEWNERVKRNAPRYARPADCPLIDLSRMDDDLK